MRPRCRRWKRNWRHPTASAPRPRRLQILAQMLKRHDRFKPQAPQEFARGGQNAKSSKGWGFAASTVDYHHECAWNLVANCRGTQRLAFVDVSNNEPDFMGCKAELRAKDFVTQTADSLSREVLIGPKVTRRLIFGDVYQAQDKAALTVNCKVDSQARRERCGRQVPRATRRHDRRAAVLSGVRQAAGHRGRCGRSLLDSHRQRHTRRRRNRALQRLPGTRRRGDRHDSQRTFQERL